MMKTLDEKSNEEITFEVALLKLKCVKAIIDGPVCLSHTTSYFRDENDEPHQEERGMIFVGNVDLIKLLTEIGILEGKLAIRARLARIVAEHAAEGIAV